MYISGGEKRRREREERRQITIWDDIDMFDNIFRFISSSITLWFKISSILLMIRRSSRSLKRQATGNSLALHSQLDSKNCLNFKDSQLSNAIETLDNTHTLMLLQTHQQLSQQMLCLRTKLAHQLNQHTSCLLFAKRSLATFPKCKSCLTVYLSHAQNIPEQDLPLSPDLLQAIEENGPDLESLLPQLLELYPRPSVYSTLVRQLTGSGSSINKVGLVQSKEGRKMIALSKINKNQQIMFIPKEQLITLEMARALPLVKNLMAARVPLRSPKHTHLAIFLLEHFELGETSPFVHYLSSLPKGFSHFPVNYPQALLAELEGTCFLQQIEHKKYDMHRDYQSVLSVDESFGRFSLQQFTHARLLVSSRVFGIVVQHVKTDALVPVADMLNHRLPKQTSWFYCDRSKGFVVQSLKEIAAGSEVFDSYGQKCNSRFLLNYGFVLPNNPYNQVALEIDLASTFEGGPKFTRIRVSRALDSKGFQEMVGLLRATLQEDVVPKQESEEEITMGLEALKQTNFQSKENEIKVWRTIDALVTSKLSQYSTSLTEDRRALQRCSDSNLRNVIVMRRGEKEVLLFYQNMSRRIVRYLECDRRRGDVAAYRCYIDSIGVREQTDP